jgi:hypothetical protein
LAESLLALDDKQEELLQDETALKTLFGEMLHMCLWGNATVSIVSHHPLSNLNVHLRLQDLSLLTNMTHADIQKLQTVSKDEQTARAQYILLDNGEQAWDQLRKSRDRVDIILDNGISQSALPLCPLTSHLPAGFEVSVSHPLSSARSIAIAIYGSGLCRVSRIIHGSQGSGISVRTSRMTISFSRVIRYSPKAMPWFVSDVTPFDFAQTISMLQSDQWSIGDQASKVLAERFQRRLDSGVFALSVPLDTKLGKHFSPTLSIFPSFSSPLIRA